VGRSRQPRMFIMVLFPEPLIPTIATNSPRATRKLTSTRARTTTVPVTEFFSTCSSSMSGASMPRVPSARCSEESRPAFLVVLVGLVGHDLGGDGQLARLELEIGR